MHPVWGSALECGSWSALRREGVSGAFERGEIRLVRGATTFVRKFTKNMGILVCFAAICLLLGIYYVSLAVRNLPLMDTWRDFSELIEPTMSGSLSFSDIWKDYIGHRYPFAKISLIVNIL